MFYTENPSNTLRLGDIVTGYITVVPNQKEPIRNNFPDYYLDIKHPNYLVVLTPCCSIGEKTLSVAPLMTILDAKRKKFFQNPFFKEDMTLINYPHTLQEWKDLGHEDVTDVEKSGKKLYTYDNLFIYAEDLRLKSYNVEVRKEEFESRYYMIDFRNISKIRCDCIVSENDKAKNYDVLLEKAMKSKILELSISSRSSLREKLAYYYRRPPKEDCIVEC